ncbi:MAG TPA: hypothetical protein VD884_09330 [Ohtaekwangia sp.]|nr:hypothetical protein [Ohtaekwangia sp.]
MNQIKYTITGVVLMIMIGFGGSLHAQTAKDQSKTADHKKFIEMIVGNWKLKSIEDAAQKKGDKSGAKKTRENQPDQGNNAMQMIEFQPNGRYKMNSSTNAIDSGSYRLSEQHGILYLESDAAETPSEWTIAIKRNVLTLNGGNQEADKRYKYVYVKTKDGLGTN